MGRKRVPEQGRRCQMGAGTREQCRAPRRLGSEYCFFHERDQQKVGEVIKDLEDFQLDTATEVELFLAEVVKAVVEKRVEAQQAYAIGCLVQQLRENWGEVKKEREREEVRAAGGYGAWLLKELGGSSSQKQKREGKKEKEEEEVDAGEEED